MDNAVAIIVDWYGPYRSLEIARQQAKELFFEDALYMATGRRAYQRHRDLQYVGITENIGRRLTNGRFPEIKNDLEVWIGAIASHGVAGKRRVRHSPMLDLAEWGTAFFLKIPLNRRKRKNPPDAAFALINHWYHPNERRRERRPFSGWPDLIEYEGRGGGARIAWLGAPPRLKKLSEADIRSFRLDL